MKTTNFDWGDNLIDSKDIISRHEELQEEYDDLVNALNEAESELSDFLKEDGHDPDQEKDKEDIAAIELKLEELHEAIEDAQDALNDFNSSYDKDELDTLTEVISEGEDCTDWSYGETLIRESYFEDYIKDLVNDCYEMPKEFNEGKWPWNHASIDFEAAAEEAKSDYSEIEVGGLTYYIRS
jgi:hypothetical protein